MICKKCGKEIDNQAVVCVHCGVAIKPKKSIFKKWWFWGILVIVIAVISIGNGGKEESGGKETGTETSVTEVQETVTYEPVELATIMEELKTNAMKAEEKYAKQGLEFSGKIKSFDSDGGYISVEPVTADEWNFDSVMCYIKTKEQKEILMEKSVGDTVTIRGKVKSVGEVLGYSVDIDSVE